MKTVIGFTKMTAFEAIIWLEACSRYFQKRDTRGEDAAHWANVYNAETALKIAELVKSLVENNQK